MRVSLPFPGRMSLSLFHPCIHCFYTTLCLHFLPSSILITLFPHKIQSSTTLTFSLLLVTAPGHPLLNRPVWRLVHLVRRASYIFHNTHVHAACILLYHGRLPLFQPCRFFVHELWKWQEGKQNTHVSQINVTYNRFVL